MSQEPTQQLKRTTCSKQRGKTCDKKEEEAQKILFFTSKVVLGHGGGHFAAILYEVITSDAKEEARVEANEDY